MNNMEKVAEMLGVKLGERFKAGGRKYYIDEEGLFDDDGDICTMMLKCLLTGEYTIEKLPWKPRFGDKYWVGFKDGPAVRYFWGDDCVDYSSYFAGNCFATHEEALAHAPEVIEKLRRKYEKA